jgi:3-deoxy-D-manno-octulosonic-acid transferase
MVSARVSERSFARYVRARSLFAPALATLARVCARDAQSAARLVALGARADVTTVCGDLKLAAIDASVVAATVPALGTPSAAAPIVLAISTHEGEEAIVLDAFVRVRRAHPRAKLVIAPRHSGRSERVRDAAVRCLPTAVWSVDRGALSPDWSALVVDTTGEMYGFLRSATCGFVGGTLAPVGGHNLAEPAAFRVPVAVGPRTGNVAHQAALLADRGALTVVRDAEELARVWCSWLDDPSSARALADAAFAAFAASGAVLERTLAAIDPLFGESPRTRAAGA